MRDDKFKIIYFDPATKAWLPNLNNYIVTPYNPASFLVEKVGDEGANLVDVEDNNGVGSCTCQDFLFRKDPNNAAHNGDNTCKHIRMIKFLLRKYSKNTKKKLKNQ